MKARLAVTLFAVFAAGCNCGQKTNSRQPKFEIPADDGSERTTFDFGSVQVGATTTATLQVRNSGASLLTVSDPSTAAPFAIVASEFPLSISPGEVGTFTVSFSPTIADKRETGTLTLSSNDPNRTSASISLAGTGITAVARAQPSPLAFGDVYAGEGKTVTLTITNAGSNALEVQSAAFTGTPATLTGNLNSVVGSIAAGASKTADINWSPTAAETTLSGSIHLALPASQGAALDVPVTGRAVQAVARMCFKFDDNGQETCADATNVAVSLQVGSLCDNNIYGPDAGALACTIATGSRSGKLYYRNEGNVPVKYSLQYQPLPYANVRCDGGSTQSDFIFSNAPATADGGNFNVATAQLPAMVTDPKPWETSPINVTYRATSRCREDAADQARILWTRQGEPPGTTRAPGSMFITLIGASKLPRGLPADLAYGSLGSPATVPFSQDFIGVVNAGDAPLVVTAVELWEELPNPFADAGIPDAGGPNGGIFQLCGNNLNSDCARFAWSPDGGDPNLRTPFVLDAGSGNAPSQAVMGRLIFAPLGAGACVNNGVACPNTPYRVYAVLYTNDPYAPVVYSKVTGVASTQ
jgi:hypothetical protein